MVPTQALHYSASLFLFPEAYRSTRHWKGISEASCTKPFLQKRLIDIAALPLCKGPDAANSATCTVEELKSAVLRIANYEDLPVRLCIFVDAVDEYQDDSANLLDFLELLCTSKNIKLCLSGRPTSVFTDAFPSSPALLLEDHTQDDIANYATSWLAEVPSWAISRESERGDIAARVASLACGSFLWVYLTVKEILHEYSSSTPEEVMLRRPAEMDVLYWSMLRAITPIHRRAIYRYLIAAAQSWKPIPLMVYWCLDCLSDPYYSDVRKGLTPAQMSKQAFAMNEESMRRRLITRSRGLLEIVTKPDDTLQGVCSVSVRCYHWTVAEFLSLDEVSEFFRGPIATAEDVYKDLVQAYALLTRTLPWNEISTIDGAALMARLVFEVLSEEYIFPPFGVFNQNEPLNIMHRLFDEFREAILVWVASSNTHERIHSSREYFTDRFRSCFCSKKRAGRILP